MKIVTGMGENGEFKVMVSSTLIKDYLPNLLGMLKSNKDCPKDIKITRDSDTSIYILFQMGEGGSLTSPMSGRIGVDEIGARPLTSVLSIVKRFSIVAFKCAMKKQQFIPLSTDYTLDELKKDLEEALNHRHSFTFVDTYDHFKEFTKNPDLEFKQYTVPYESEEFIDICLSIHRGDIEGLRKKYSKKLESFSWV